MRQRFTIIQGGLSDRAPAASGASPLLADRWRVVLRPARSFEEPEIAAWRALIARQPHQDVFADPDYLLTAARHGARGSEIAFALIHAGSGAGPDTLVGVVPLLLTNPAWGGAPVRLWHPPLAPHPIQPVLDIGCAGAALEAVIRHLCGRSTAAMVRLERIASAGSLLRALHSHGRLSILSRAASRPVPVTSFVDVRTATPEVEFERVTAPAEIRDAVERFLLAEAQASRASLLADPVNATITRVVTRLFAQKGWVGVELGRRGGEVVCGAIRVGQGPERALWRSVGLREPFAATPPVEDVDVSLAETAGGDDLARVRLIGP